MSGKSGSIVQMTATTVRTTERIKIPFRVVPALKILLLGVCCAAVSILFCILLHQTEHLLKKRCKNPYVRILIASGVIWVLALLVRNQDYLGIGGEVMRRAVAREVVWYAFLAKMIFTAVTLGGGVVSGSIARK